eukprot:gene24033-32444_t
MSNDSMNESAPKLVGLGSVFHQLLIFSYTFFTTAMTVCPTVAALTVAEFIISYYADKSESKYGRRKPYVVIGAIISCVGTLMLCIPPGTSGLIVPLWYLLSSVIVSVGRGVSGNPYNSWLIESCINNAEYRALVTIPINIGTLTGALFGALLVAFIPIVAAVASVLGTIVSTCLLIYYVPSVVHQQVAKLPPLIPSLRMASRTNEFRTIFTNRVLIQGATSIFGNAASFLVLVGFNVASNSDFVIYSILLGVVGTIAGLCLNIAMNWLLRCVEKLRVYLNLAAAVMVLSTVAFIPANIPNATALVIFLLIIVLLTIVGYPIYLIESLMVRDLILYDTFITGLNRENTYYTAITVPTAILAAFLSAIPIAALSLSGFKQNTVDDDNLSDIYSWTPTTIWILRICCGVVTPIIAGLSYYLISRYPLSQKISDQINDAIRRKEDKAAEGDSEQSIGKLKELETPGNNEEAFRLVILHLSVEEIHRVANGPGDKATGKNLGLLLLNRYNLVSVLLSGLTSLLLVVSFFIDASLGSNQFTTLMLAIFLITFSLFTYEFMRRGAIVDMATWDAVTLKAVAKAVYDEFSTYHETLRDKLSRGAIDVTEEEEKPAEEGGGPLNKKLVDNTHSSLFNPIQDVEEVTMIIERSNSAGGQGEEDAVTPTRGYKRIFSTLLAVIALTIIVITLDTTR